MTDWKHDANDWNTMIAYVITDVDDYVKGAMLFMSRAAARQWMTNNDCAECKIRRAKLTIYGS